MTSRLYLYPTVFITGAVVMVIELLGTRFIAPFYGSSLYVWASLIAVTMIALALGYYFGGRLADRGNGSGFGVILALAGLLTLIIPLLSRPVLLMTDPLGLRAGAFISSLVLFSPGLTLLGMVSPFAIKLATDRLSGVGASAGSIYAVSTVGSVIGTIALGFFLFPFIGSRAIMIGSGVVLITLALVMAWIQWRQFQHKPLTLLTAVFAAFGVLMALVNIFSARDIDTDPYQVRFEQESLYGWVRVIDEPKRKFRVLTSDASMIGAANLNTGENIMAYQKIVGLLPNLRQTMRTALVIGQGAGHMAMVLHDRYGMTVDTLELDPAVATAATDYFDFKPSGEFRLGDARYHIRRLKGPYDLIIHDCFTGGTEPVHLLTRETLLQLRGLLSEQGLLALNFVAFWQNGENPALTSVKRTLAAVFPKQQTFISEPGEAFNDFIFLASRHAIELEDSSLSPSGRSWLQQRKVTIPASGALLTDDLNPLEHLQRAKSEHYRNVMVDWFGTGLLLR